MRSLHYGTSGAILETLSFPVGGGDVPDKPGAEVSGSRGIGEDVHDVSGPTGGHLGPRGR